MSHYYDIQGNPHHTVPTKRGAKNPFRATTIRDAKANGWFPSVSAYTDILDKPGLKHYHCKGAARIALERGLSGPEELDEAAHQIATDYVSQGSSEAADIGTAIHAEIEKWATGIQWSEYVDGYGGEKIRINDVLTPIIGLFAKHDLTEEKSEFVTVNPNFGYAGTVDMLARREGRESGLLDFKTTKTKPGEPIVYRETHPVQLAAYHASVFNPGKAAPEIDWTGHWAANVYISTTEIGRVEIKFWTPEELAASFEAFTHMLALWKWKNGWKPEAAHLQP